ncbi:hypothetical protein FHG87_019733 [Trinorchestia longiramus]|nr:hypothetical protein FHG87_019733 [Trinorchestia longiramus]
MARSQWKTSPSGSLNKRIRFAQRRQTVTQQQSCIADSFWKLSSTTSTGEISTGTSRSLGSLGGCKRASQSTVAFSVYGTVRLCSNTTNRRTGDLGELFVPGEHKVQENPLVDMNKVFLPAFHIKLGLMKNSVKVMDKNGAAFQHLCTLFPALSSARFKEGIFVGSQIRERHSLCTVSVVLAEMDEALLVASHTYTPVSSGLRGATLRPRPRTTAARPTGILPSALRQIT